MIAPVNSRGYVLLDQMKALWDNPVWIGCSIPLARLLSDEKTILELLQRNVIGAKTVTPESINGIRQQNLLYLPHIASVYPHQDMSMKVVYRGIDARIADADDLAHLTHVTNLVDSNMDNATPILGRMIVDTVNSFPIKLFLFDLFAYMSEMCIII